MRMMVMKHPAANGAAFEAVLVAALLMLLLLTALFASDTTLHFPLVHAVHARGIASAAGGVSGGGGISGGGRVAFFRHAAHPGGRGRDHARGGDRDGNRGRGGGGRDPAGLLDDPAGDLLAAPNGWSIEPSSAEPAVLAGAADIVPRGGGGQRDRGGGRERSERGHGKDGSGCSGGGRSAAPSPRSGEKRGTEGGDKGRENEGGSSVSSSAAGTAGSAASADEAIRSYVDAVERNDELKRSEDLYGRMMSQSAVEEDSSEEEEEEQEDEENEADDESEAANNGVDEDGAGDDERDVAGKDANEPKNKKDPAIPDSDNDEDSSSPIKTKRIPSSKRHPEKSKSHSGRRNSTTDAKSNAVGDPDGNSSDSEEESDSELGDSELDKLDELGEEEGRKYVEEMMAWKRRQEQEENRGKDRMRNELGIELEILSGDNDGDMHPPDAVGDDEDHEEANNGNNSNGVEIEVKVDVMEEHSDPSSNVVDEDNDGAAAEQQQQQQQSEVVEGIEVEAATFPATTTAAGAATATTATTSTTSVRGGSKQKHRRPRDDGGDEDEQSGEEVGKANGGGGGGDDPSALDDPVDGNTADKDDDNNDDDAGAATTTSSPSDSLSDRARARQSLRDLEESQAAAFDAALVKSFLPHLFLPPPPSAIEMMRSKSREIDVAGRRRLDRRCLYEGLVVELTHAHSHGSGGKEADGKATGKAKGKKGKTVSPPKRRFLDPSTTRSLRSALSLASQPKWRKHVALGSRLSLSGAAPSSSAGVVESADDGDAVIGDDATAFYHPNILRLYPTDEEIVMAQNRARMAAAAAAGQGQEGVTGMMPGMPNMGWGQGGQGEEDDGEEAAGAEGGGGGTGEAATDVCTMGMQETTAMAVAHSLSAGLFLLDDDAISSIRRSLLSNPNLNLDASSPQLRPAKIIDSLCRLAEEGRFAPYMHVAKDADGGDSATAKKKSCAEGGRISHRMERDLTMGLDDPNDDLAVESFKLMKDDEDCWYGDSKDGAEEGAEDEDSGADDAARPLPLVVFLRTSASPGILKSRSTVDIIARESVRQDSIHLMVLGRGIDAATDDLQDLPGNAGAVGAANNRMASIQQQQQQQQMQEGQFNPFANMMPNAGQQQGMQQPNPFANMSPNPPGLIQPGNGPGGFSAENINASGVNDPPGSMRFNIFLARTVDPEGNPGIMGAIAPPNAGNLLPRMSQMVAEANQQRQQQQQQEQQQQGDGQGAPQGFDPNSMQKWAELMSSQMQNMQGQNGENPNALPPQFFNASIGGLPNLGGPNGQLPPGATPPPPEMVQRAIQEAMNGVIERLAQMNADDQSPQAGGNKLPPHLAKAFALILRNPSLRSSLALNLSRAAPALVDPRCQGVMLSVYVPPGPESGFRGMMPGQQFAKNKNQGKPRGGNKMQPPPQGQGQEAAASQPPSQHATRGWLNKILSSTKSPSQAAAEEEEDLSDNEEEEEQEEEVEAADVDDADSESDEEEEPDEPAVLELSDDAVVDLDMDDEAIVDDQEIVDASLVAEDEESVAEEETSSKKKKRSRRSKKQRMKKKLSSTKDRIRNLAAAAAVLNAQKKEVAEKEAALSSKESKSKPLTAEQKSAAKAQRNLQRLQTLSRPITLFTPTDPVRSRSWQGWIEREVGAVLFRSNRRALNAELDHRRLKILTSVSKGAGSILRQMLSVRDLSSHMEEIVRSAVEIEAARSQRMLESPWDGVEEIVDDVETGKAIDTSLGQLILTHVDDEQDATEAQTVSKKTRPLQVQYLHPSSLESAISLTCRISPSPSGGASSTPLTGAGTAHHRTREDLSALANDKHERALISQVVLPNDIGVSYDMIGGLDNVKELLRQSITYPLKYPHLYSEGIAREAVKGVLLFGPPGTGKTMLAKAVATEGGATFLSVDASSIENKWLGESEKNAKAVFTLARRLAPCVIFIDEVDSILSSREGSSDDSAHGTLTSVKTTMMSEWDGLNSGTNGKGEAGSDRVIVIGSTNRPFDLDEAVLRRFPRRILVDLPDMETRREILEVTLAENRLAGDVNLTKIAERLEGYTGSDIKEVCREAVVQISHEQARVLDQGFLDEGNDLEGEEDSSGGGVGTVEAMASLQRLRPCTMKDFESAMKKLKKSVSEKGRELQRVVEWNDEYGEIKSRDKSDKMGTVLNMFL